MLMNAKILFDSSYCVDSAKKKEIMMHFILKPRHIFIRVKVVFILTIVPGGLQILNISTCFSWRPVSNIIKCRVLTARAHVNRHINKLL